MIQNLHRFSLREIPRPLFAAPIFARVPFALAISLAFASGSAPSVAQATKPAQDAPNAGSAAAPAGGRALLGAIQDALVGVADACEPAVVTISARKTVRTTSEVEDDGSAKGWGQNKTKTYRSQGTGSGVSSLQKDGWILTNDHVVRARTSYRSAARWPRARREGSA